jgi:hypothetical protein
MFGLLCAAATLLFLPLTGWKAVAAAAGGAFLLLIGLSVRGELFLALPWLVLCRVDLRSIRQFISSGLLRSIAPALALAVFVVLQHSISSSAHAAVTSTIGTYFMESYGWATVLPGVLYMTVGCGFATVAAALIAGLYLVRKATLSSGPSAKPQWSALLSVSALIVVPLVFFLPNPAPPRHFHMTLAGMGILIGVALAARPALGRIAALGIALAIGVANQVMAEVLRPTLLRANEAHSPYLPVPTEYPTATHANLGWEWRRHAALVEKRERWQAFGETLRTSCDPNVIVLSDEVEQLFSRLYAGGTAVEARRISINVDAGAAPINPALRQDPTTLVIGQGDNKLTGTIGERRGKTFVMLEKSHLWPGDAVATILADPAFDKYKLIADPYTLSKFDKTPVPADRAPHFGCSDAGS